MIFIVLAYWSNSPQIDMSPHLDTIALTQKLLNFKIKKVLTFAIHDEVIGVVEYYS
jgi:hypothetical protein